MTPVTSLPVTVVVVGRAEGLEVTVTGAAVTVSFVRTRGTFAVRVTVTPFETVLSVIVVAPAETMPPEAFASERCARLSVAPELASMPGQDAAARPSITAGVPAVPTLASVPATERACPAAKWSAVPDASVSAPPAATERPPVPTRYGMVAVSVPTPVTVPESWNSFVPVVLAAVSLARSFGRIDGSTTEYARPGAPVTTSRSRVMSAFAVFAFVVDAAMPPVTFESSTSSTPVEAMPVAGNLRSTKVETSAPVVPTCTCVQSPCAACGVAPSVLPRTESSRSEVTVIREPLVPARRSVPFTTRVLPAETLIALPGATVTSAPAATVSPVAPTTIGIWFSESVPMPVRRPFS